MRRVMTQEERERQREYVRRAENKAAERGDGRVCIRLNPNANRMMKAICERYNCTPRGVVEGLLLGNVRHVVDRPHGLSQSEMEYAEGMGVRL